MLKFQFEGRAMINVVADVFFVGEDLVNCAARPRPPKIRDNTFRIQLRGDFGFIFAVEECSVNPADDFDLLIRPAH